MPAGLIGRRVRVAAAASELLIFDGQAQVAPHRAVRPPAAAGADSGPLPGGAGPQARRAARRDRAGPGPRRAARSPRRTTRSGRGRAARHGDAAGTRALIEVLLLHRRLRHADVVAGLTAAGTVGASSADVVAVEARKAADRPGDYRARAESDGRAGEPVVSLTQRRLADPAAVTPLPADHRRRRR